jgi:hypothetical protein
LIDSIDVGEESISIDVGEELISIDGEEELIDFHRRRRRIDSIGVAEESILSTVENN